ncbi:MAG: translocation/assembly module TamB [Ectothiorhodospiraceae bacterium]|nr:translocation/assembly module TamB [Ectothiorhodospiraceae bacterium]
MNRVLRALRLLAHGLLLVAAKALRIVYVLLVTLLVLLAWLLFTTSGAQWLAERAMNEEPRLHLEVRDGSLLQGLDIQELRWTDTGVAVAVDQAALRWNLVCLLGLRVCLDRLHGEGVQVSVDTTAFGDGDGQPTDSGEERGGVIRLPVTLGFPDVLLENAALSIDGHQVNWQRLALGGSFRGRALTLDHVDWETVHVRMEPERAGAEPAPSPVAEERPDIAALLDPATRQPVELPRVDSPIDVHLMDFRLQDARFHWGGREEHLRLLRLSGALEDRRLTLGHLVLEHPQLRLRADGQVRLEGAYPLDLDLDLEARDLPGLGDLRLELQAWNAVADLELRMTASGPGELRVEGRLAALQPELSHALDIRWTGLRWPVLEEARFRSHRGRLELEGDLHGYALDLDVALSGEDIPDGQVSARGAGDYRGAELALFRIDALDGWLEAAGRVSWEEAIRWDAWVRMDGIDAVPLHPEAPDGIAGELRTRGELLGDVLDLDVEIERLQARIPREDLPLRLDGVVRHRPDRGWLLEGLRLDAGLGNIAVSGRVHETLELEAAFNLPDLAALLPDAAGAVSGTLRADGPLTAPDVDLDLEGERFSYGELARLGELSVQARVLALGERESRVQVELRGLEAPEAGVAADRLALSLEGTRSSHQLSALVQGAPVELDLLVRGRLSDEFAWAGELVRAALDGAGMAWELEEPMPVVYRPESRDAILGAHCWVYRTARLCAEEDITAGAVGGAAVSLAGYELDWLNPWLPPDLRVDGSIQANVNARWGDTPLPRVEGALRILDGHAEMTDPDDPEVVVALELDTLALDLALTEQRLDLLLELRSEGLGAADAEARVAVGGDGSLGALDGRVRLTGLNVGVVAPFFPELRRLEGEVNAEARVAGTLYEPMVQGELRLDSGLVEPLALPVTISEITVQVDVEGDRAEIAGGFRSGAGEASLSGQAQWQGGAWGLELGLRGNRLEAAYEDMIWLRVSPDLLLNVEPGAIRLSGSVNVPRGEITIQRLPEGTVGVSPDVVFVDEEVAAEIPLPEDLQTPAGWGVTTDVEVILGDRIAFSGFGLSGRITGALRVRQVDDGVLQANGELRIEDGGYRAYGQRLRIREGQFLFAGPIDAPEIYVEAVREITRSAPGVAQPTTVVAGLRIEGRPESPRLSLFSEPAMSDDDILSYIILGRPVGESGPEGGSMMAQAALALGIAGGGGYATAVAEGLGIEDFEIDTEGEGDETQFVVRGQLSSNLFVSYGVGVFQPGNEITLRYRLARSLYLQAVTGLESALDLLYSFEF